MSSNTNPVYGNYHGYYSKRPSVRDPRLSLLPANFFAGKIVLDIGCNEGWVTCEIGQSWGAQKVVGVDIDETLIRAAWRRRRSLWSQQVPERNVSGPIPEPISSKRARRHRVVDSNTFDYFPTSCEYSHGALPIPSNATGVARFPYNVTFRTADWVTEDGAADDAGYDVVLAFSITKWIHLNYGDDGIKQFFRRIYKCLNTGGTLVLEPQAWGTYTKAKRMDERLKENAKHLQLRPENFSAILREIGFGPPTQLGSVGEGGFRRPVDLYVKL